MYKKLLLITGTLLAQSANAGTTETVDSFVDIFIGMLTGSVGKLFIILIIVMSAVMAWRNGNLTPLFWGLAAAFIIGAAPQIAEGLIADANKTFGG